MRRASIPALLLLVACGDADSKSSTAAPAPASPCNQQQFEGDRFTVCESGGGPIQLFAAARGETPIRRFADLEATLGRRGEQVAFAMNAGMFDEDGRPIGLAIVDGREVHAINRRKGGGNFHLMPNGVFLVRRNGRASVVTSAAFKPSKDIALATQSGPMLVIDGQLHLAFDPDGTSRYIRNGVGIAPDGRARFVISEQPVSLGKFARLFRDGLKSRNALFFDGAVSALWDPANGRRDDIVPLGPMVVVFRPAESAPGRAGRATP
ncbi:MAG: phosphodiester glycosidase family protein [Sphingomicrobium sp.]